MQLKKSLYIAKKRMMEGNVSVEEVFNKELLKPLFTAITSEVTIPTDRSCKRSLRRYKHKAMSQKLHFQTITVSTYLLL